MAFSRSALSLCCAALAASSGAHAVSFGKVSPAATLGQPLSVLIPIRLDQGERMFAECVQAEVLAGDAPLLPSQVRVAVFPTANPAEWQARVSTLVPIEEPVLEVSVSAGCERRFMRRFTAFADPPMLAAAAPIAPSMPLVSALPETEPVPPQTRAERGRPVGEPVASAPVRAAPRRHVDEAGAGSRVPAPKKPRKAAAKAVAVPRSDQTARLLLDAGSGPQLKMDLDEPIFMPAGSAAAASGSEASPELAQLQVLEKSLRDLRKESQAKQASELSLRAQLSEAESKGRMLPWLVGLVLLACGAAIWLALRLRNVQNKADQAGVWWRGQAAGDQGPVPEPALTDEGELIDLPVKAVAGAPAVARRELDEPTDEPVMADDTADTRPFFDPQKTQPMAAPMWAGGATMASAGMSSIVDGQAPAREVSVEELLDLEQQADFFIALGQEDAAGDLLMSHLRSTGGLSPLPYTKLLEIYRRQGDRAAYERIRARFNRRFNVYAPDWDVGPAHGRTLEDYPDVVAQLQDLWPSHLNAMAVLEAMLFRNDERQELFDLPAYKDVLMLYSLARDLYQQEGVTAADVDLLLPLGDHSAHARDPLPAAQRASSYDMTAFSLDDTGGGRVSGPDEPPTER